MPGPNPPDSSDGAGISDAPTADLPSQIGPYRILGTLGEGGMGVVYEAEQLEPVQRKVAIKLIRGGGDFAEVAARFDAERQALAVMEHPHIAKVWDGGTTAGGSPYFVMEYVDGLPITEYCDANELGIAARIRLFTEVCDAVQHAHQKGIIHRDLKPNNVLVTEQAGSAHPKVIDFGIAKAAGVTLTDKTMATQFGAMMGTPAYMSPEQAGGSELDIDTRADVYALGVILYELLVGKVPLNPEEMGFPAFLAGLVMEDILVPTPSTGLGANRETAITLSSRRRTTPEELRRHLKGDLDWIVMKAIETDRERRYDTANLLALDLERYLDHEPVLARPPTARYRLGKFVRRNRAGVAAAAIGGLAIVAGAGAAVTGMLRAQVAEAVAQEEAVTAQEVSDFLVGLFEVSDPSKARGREVTAREILDQGAREVEFGLADQPAVQARLQRVIGQVYHGLALYDEAEALLVSALATQRAAAATRELAPTLIAVGDLYWMRDRIDDAVAQYQEAIAVLEADAGSNPLRLAEALTALAGLRSEGQADYDGAVQLLDRSLAIQERELGLDDPGLGPTLVILAQVYRSQERFLEAEPIAFRALGIREAALPENHPEIGESLHSLAVIYSSQGRFDDADVLWNRYLELSETVYGRAHPEVAKALEGLGIHLAMQEHRAEAKPFLQRALEIREQVWGLESIGVAISLNNLAYLNMRTEDWEEAERLYLRALGINEKSFPAGHPAIANAFSGVGGALLGQGRLEEAELFLEKAFAMQESLGPDYPPGFQETLGYLTRLLRETGRASEAESIEARFATIVAAGNEG